MSAKPDQKLNHYLDSWKKDVSKWSSSKIFLQAVNESFLLTRQAPGITRLSKKWGEGDFSDFPNIKSVKAVEIDGANAVYSNANDYIYVNEDWLFSTTKNNFDAVLTEELGHFLDDQFNRDDTPGDEGKRFSRVIETGGSLSTSEKARLLVLNDLGLAQTASGIEQVERNIELPLHFPEFRTAGLQFTAEKTNTNIGLIPQASINGVIVGSTNSVDISGAISLSFYLSSDGSFPRELSSNYYQARFSGNPLDESGLVYFNLDLPPETEKWVQYSLDSGATWSKIAVGTAAFSYSNDDYGWANIAHKSFPNGLHATGYFPKLSAKNVTLPVDSGSILLEIRDSIGNVSPLTTLSYSIDKVAPTAKINGIDFVRKDGLLSESMTTDEGVLVFKDNPWRFIGLDQPTDIDFMKINLDSAIEPGARLYVCDSLGNNPVLLSESISGNSFMVDGFPGHWREESLLSRMFSDTFGSAELIQRGLYFMVTDSVGNFGEVYSAPPIQFAQQFDVDLYKKGGLANDLIYGYDGNDYIDASEGNDTVYGGSGNDDIYGGTGRDNLYGGTGDDFLNAGDGSDSLYGGAGSDILIGGDGRDTLVGGAGDDSYVLDDPFDFITDQGLAADSDTVIIRYQISSYTLVGGVKNADISGNSAVTSLTGSSQDNMLIGNNSGNVINGLDGNDNLVGGSGNDILNGGSGTDTINFSALDEAITLNMTTATASGIGIGSDSVVGFEIVLLGGGDDQIIGSSRSDTIGGGLGIDNIASGAGNDQLIGGDGDDLLNGGAGNDTLNGGAGADTADYSNATGMVAVNLATGIVSGTQGADRLNAVENVIGGSAADTLTGSGVDNTLNGGAGNDTLNGSTGTDTADYSNAAGIVTINLLAGIATGSQGVDRLISIENTNGGLGGDTLIGSTGVNTLNGAAGDDALNGNAGNDFLDGGDGADTAVYSTATRSVAVNLTTGIATGALGVDTLVDIENVTGGGGADALTGNEFSNSLDGGAGNDSLNGGLGADTLTGSAGTDRFIYTSSTLSLLYEFDRITDLAIGTDLVDSSIAVSANNLQELGAVSALTEEDLSLLLNANAFMANGAATFTLGSGRDARTFLAINDRFAGFSSATDAVIEITGFSGELTMLAII